MAEQTAIEWCDSTFNPWIGCTRVSPGCDHCYAAGSTPARTIGVAWGPKEQRHRTAASTWKQPERWEREHEAFFAQHGRRRRVFCASLADVFDNAASDAWRADLFQLIADTPHLDWLLLTKRIGNAAGMLPYYWSAISHHILIGATLVNREEMLRDAGKLNALPARTFWSVEPMLGDLGAIPRELLPDWVICGGESGPHARPMHPDWARSLRDQCAAAGVPFLFKQWGEWLPAETDRPGDGECYAVAEDGSERELSGRLALQVLAGQEMLRVGKKAAGRLLNGVEHNGFPEVR